MRTLALEISLPALCVLGCGGGGDTAAVTDATPGDATPGDRYAPGLTKRGDTLQFTLVEALPAPPQRGQNAWTVAVADLAGSPQAGCTISATVFMPEHGHGSPVAPTVSETETAGEYTLAGVDLFMPRLWEVTLRATCAQGEDSAVFAFWIER